MKIKKGDTVKILLGKDRGKTGKVLRVLAKKGKVLVEGVNAYKRHVRKMKGMEGGIIEINKPIDISNVRKEVANVKA
ncbi:50S ribosomal protein L24 [Candidatus Daviesbacteria bacterium RIFOXYD1_FULL_41_10]|uniref:Large ribosomal subunit protein uL24 n=2 Tax=Candidatus Daviesiibacteriota TaxID=1752718 RepID=A0A1F5MZ07_9BACT|nr:MAG: 50S ribosomal protein L24 [Candidatus Daviesbacteria bacterium GW2011_GWB1_41_5]OGE70597.1 MAG: 50S ribosomal protein L24 [Candidatus Daviesbacteria bacterium RIFOXYD1_FULL_41_10]